MPASTERQAHAMFAAAEGHSTLGIPKVVGEEFVAKDAVNGTAAGLMFVAPDGDILMLRRRTDDENWAGHWDLPGGKGEDGETPEDIAAREAFEETGITAYNPRKLLDSAVTPKGMAFHTYVQPVDTKFVPTLSEEHIGFTWTPLDQLPEPIHPGVKRTLDLRLGLDLAEAMTDEDWIGLKAGFADWARLLYAPAQDALAIDEASVRSYDTDGRLHVSLTPISKANVCEYYGREIPDAARLGLQADRKYRLLRHPDELARAVPTFNNVPLLRRHVPVSADDHRPEDVVGATGTDSVFDFPYLMNSLVVWSKSDIDEIEKEEKRELSSSYRYRADMTPGTFEGEPYDGIMRDIVGNHVALVKEGRAGPDVLVGDEKPSPTKEVPDMRKHVLTRAAALVHGALAAHVIPLLAADASIDFMPLLDGITKDNFADRRAELLSGVSKLATGKLAKDAKLDGLDKVLVALDEVMPEEDKPEPGGGKGEGPAKDKKAKDKKMSRDELKESLKGKMSAEDWAAACDDIDGMAAEDDDPEDERNDPEGTNKAEDSVTKDDLKTAVDEAITAERANERKRAADIREAERFVRPWVGDMTVAFDSAEDVYKAALESRGKSVKGVHPSAYRSILEMLPKPGTEKPTRHAMDAAQVKSFSERFPGSDRIRIGGAA